MSNIYYILKPYTERGFISTVWYIIRFFIQIETEDPKLVYSQTMQLLHELIVAEIIARKHSSRAFGYKKYIWFCSWGILRKILFKRMVILSNIIFEKIGLEKMTVNDLYNRQNVLRLQGKIIPARHCIDNTLKKLPPEPKSEIIRLCLYASLLEAYDDDGSYSSLDYVIPEIFKTYEKLDSEVKRSILVKNVLERCDDVLYLVKNTDYATYQRVLKNIAEDFMEPPEQPSS